MDSQQEAELGVSTEAEAAGKISARERDLDNFLLEEISASEKFRAWLFSRLSEALDVPAHSRVVVGKNPKREAAVGQTDLSVACLDQEGNQAALLLVESKVALGFQPGQPDRYRLEVESARNRLGHRRAAAVVVAPQSNRQVLDHSHFDATILIEEIIGHLKERIGSDLTDKGELATELRGRLESKIELLEFLAGKRAQPNWTPNPVPERLNFMELYRHLALEIAPGLRPTQSSGGGRASTVLFTGLEVAGLSCKGIRHDFGKAQCVSLALQGAAAAKDRIVSSALLPPNALIEATRSGTLMIRIATPRLSPTASEFATQRSEIQQCIECVLELASWARTNAKKLAILLGDAKSIPRTVQF